MIAEIWKSSNLYLECFSNLLLFSSTISDVNHGCGCGDENYIQVVSKWQNNTTLYR